MNKYKVTMNKLISSLVIGGMLFIPSHCLAGVITDGTVGPGTILSGPDYQISDSLGTTVGPNLFHSFHAFSIDHRESATFSGPETIQNVMSRITGGEVSTIDGLLRSEIGQAAFYFINPAGIVFGENAQVDVPAAFHVSSADGLYFADGSVFSAVSPDISTLSMSQPESLGFLSAQPARIEVNGAVLEFTAESTVSLSSGDITIQGPGAALRNPGGEISLTALGRATGVVALAENLPSTVGGTLLLDSAVVESSGDGGGHIVVHAGTVSMDGATVAADNSGDSPASGGIDLLVDGTLSVSHGSRVQSSVWAAGDSGGIRVEAENVLIEQQDYDTFTGFFTEVEAAATGNAGTIDIQVMDEMRIQGVGGISSATYGTGDAGSVLVSAGDLLIDGEGRSAPYRTSNYIAGISSEADFNATGNAGTVAVTVEKNLSLVNGCALNSYSSGTGTAGTVFVRAGELTIDDGESGNFTAIISNAHSGSEDYDKAVEVIVDGLLELRSGGQIFSATPASGNAGSVMVTAGNLKVDGKGLTTTIGSQANPGSNGHSGPVEITVSGLLELINGAKISSSTWSKGNAGSVIVDTGELKIDGKGNTDLLTGIMSNAYPGSEGDGGRVTITVGGLLELLNGAAILSSTLAKGEAGRIMVNAEELEIIGQGNPDWLTGIASNANLGSEGTAGIVEITVTGLLKLVNGGEISSSTRATGNGGRVIVNAGQLQIDNQGNTNQTTGIASNAETGSKGTAGTITISVSGLLELMNGAQISSSTWAPGDAGSVTVNAGQLKIDNQDNTGGITGIGSTAELGSAGTAGTVTITVSGLLELLNGAKISSSTWATGDGGSVIVTAGELKMNGQGKADQLTGIVSNANAGSAGAAGTVTIMVSGLLELISGARISSSTWTPGDAGSVTVNAGEVYIDAHGAVGQFTGIASTAEPGSEGTAGSVTLTVAGLLELINGAQVTSSTWARGDAGSVIINAEELKIDDLGNMDWLLTGVGSTAEPGSEGNAGTVTIMVDDLLELRNGAEISSSTWATGDAGSVMVNAKNICINGALTGISSAAAYTATGYVGDVLINSESIRLVNGGQISISAFQTLPEDRLAEMEKNAICISAINLHLDQHSQISAESSANVPAGAINILANRALIENSSRITTLANDADGGPITLQGGVIFLNDALITTSVEGVIGNGGDISVMGISTNECCIAADFLILNGGVIQANTGAAEAIGGDIFLNSGDLIASSNNLEIGGAERYTFIGDTSHNVIQAAAPGGEQGLIRLSATPLNLSGSLQSLNADLTEPIQLATDPCSFSGKEGASSLVFSGSIE